MSNPSTSSEMASTLRTLVRAILPVGDGTLEQQRAWRRQFEREERRFALAFCSIVVAVPAALIALGFWLGRITIHQ